MTEEGEALAQHVAAELRDPEPKGFTFDEAVLRQDASLQRLAEYLGKEPEASVAEALGRLLEQERDGWVQLKVLELADRLAPAAAAPALIAYVEARAGAEEPRVRFLAGRAREGLLRPPLDLEAPAKGPGLSPPPPRGGGLGRGPARRP